MLMKQIIEAYEVLDSSYVTGEAVKKYLQGIKEDADIEVYELVGPKGSTDMLKVRIPGKNGKAKGGDAPTIGLLGRLGGIGARPERIGFVSDGDGALCAVALAAKLLDMQNKGDYLDGDVFISTHICPDAPTAPHDPVPFMGSPVEMSQVNKEEVSPKFVEENETKVEVPEGIDLNIIKSTVWNEYSERCIACGRCNFVCPTCTCFTMQDVFYKDNENAGERRRVWASCQVDGYTDMVDIALEKIKVKE